jgi:hypothetical protein
VNKEEATKDMENLQAERERLEKLAIPIINEFLGIGQDKLVAGEEEKRKYLNRLLAIAGFSISLQEQMKTILLLNKVEEDKLENLLRAMRQDARENAKELETKFKGIKEKLEETEPHAGG